MFAIRRFRLVGLAVFGVAQLALAGTGASASPPAAKQKADHVRNLLQAYFQGRERSLFFATAGLDGEISKAEFTSAAGKANSFVRPYDRWAAAMAFDSDRNGRLGWVEAERYRLSMRKRVLALYDKDGDGRLKGPERKAASANLAAGTRRPRTATIQACFQPVSMHHAPQPASALLPQYSHRLKSNARNHAPSSSGCASLRTWMRHRNFASRSAAFA